MLDVDIEGTATRLSPEAPVPVADADRVWHRPGGAGLGAVLAARAGHDVALVTALSDDADGCALEELLREAGMDVLALPSSGNTVCKTRIRARGQSMLRLDHGDGTATGDVLPRRVPALFDKARAVCVADYGRGVAAHPEIRELLSRICERIPVVWDPHPRGATPTPGCWLVTPNQAEAQDASAESLRDRWRARAVSVTMGSAGALLSTAAGSVHVPVPEVAGTGDPCGGGEPVAVAPAVGLREGSGRPVRRRRGDGVRRGRRCEGGGHRGGRRGNALCGRRRCRGCVQPSADRGSR